MKLKKIIYSTLIVFTLLIGCSSEERDKADVKEKIGVFFEYMLLEDADSIMDMLIPETDFYYDFYTQILNTFEEYSLNYKPNEILFENLTESKQIVDVLVDVNGIAKDKTEVSYEALYTFTFEFSSKDNIKIEHIDIKYSY